MNATATTAEDFIEAMGREPCEEAHRLVFQDWMQEGGLWDELALRRLICERPDLDGLRLNYADWCGQTGRCFTEGVVRRKATTPMIRWAGTDKGSLWGPYDAVGFLHQELEILHDIVASVADRLPAMTRATVRMGFVDAVETTCADWLAHDPELVLCHPITEVRLTDQEPGRWPEEILAPFWRDEADGGAWFWRDHTSGNGVGASMPATIIDQQLFALLKGKPESQGVTNFHIYQSRQAALDDLSLAAVAWARSKAGLPPLEVTP